VVGGEVVSTAVVGAAVVVGAVVVDGAAAVAGAVVVGAVVGGAVVGGAVVVGAVVGGAVVVTATGPTAAEGALDLWRAIVTTPARMTASAIAARAARRRREEGIDKGTGLRSKLHRCDLPGYGVVTPAEQESPEQPPAATHRLPQLVEFGLEPAALRIVGRRVQFRLLGTKCSFSSRTGIDDAGHAPKHCTAAPVDQVGGDRHRRNRAGARSGPKVQVDMAGEPGAALRLRSTGGLHG